MKFLKMHGLGNDFVILDGVVPTPAQAKLLSDRHCGIGCDQVIVVAPPKSAGAHMFMHVFNADGSESGACGNATRCVAHRYMRANNVDVCVVETRAGLLPCRLTGDAQVQVDMGPPRTAVAAVTLPYPGFERAFCVDMGNPHCVAFVPDADAYPLTDIGPRIENDAAFPNRTNVEVVSRRADGALRARVWERGAGITLACGSGACAVMVAAVAAGYGESRATVVMDGGALYMERENETGHILMTGPVAYVFEGVVDI